jgi:putative hydroxymethylpyrimidine transporter CytX
MSRVANAAARGITGVDLPFVWLVVVAVVCTLLALGGPILVVRRWLERFGIWVVAGVAVWITFRILAVGDLGAAWHRPGTGGLPFWAAVDLVIAMPVSWLPLVADYNRFARDERGAFAGTFWSYAAGNAWFYALGALLVLAAGASPDVLDVGTTVAATAGGAVVLLALLVGESDNAMANVYSSAVSMQNLGPDLPQRPLIVAIGVLGFALAAFLSNAAGALEVFLFLIGSIFVPLFGVFAADYFVLARGRYGEASMFGAVDPGVRWRALVPWAGGFLLYQWCVPTGPTWWIHGAERLLHGSLRLPFPLIAGSPLGASIPSFLGAFALALLLLRRPTEDRPIRRRAPAGAR